MITGTVTPDLDPVIPLTVRGPYGSLDRIPAVVDTGFNGALTLPLTSIQRIGLTWKRRAFVELADGSQVPTDVYEGLVDWDGIERRVAVDAAETEPLAGMTLMKSYRLTVEVNDGGRVTLEKLAP